MKYVQRSGRMMSALGRSRVRKTDGVNDDWGILKKVKREDGVYRCCKMPHAEYL